MNELQQQLKTPEAWIFWAFCLAIGVLAGIGVAALA